MRTGIVRYLIDSDNGLSPSLWKDCPVDEINADNNIGYGVFDDFTKDGFRLTTPTTQADFGPYKAFSDTGGALAEGDAKGGTIVLSSDGDNEGASIAMRQLPFQISADCKSLWMEARIKSSTITDTKHGFIIGLFESLTLSATVPIAAAGTLADQNFVGFHRLEGDGDQLDTVYKANGVTQVTVKADAVDGLSGRPAALVADTYIKVGMKWDFATGILSFYINGKVLPDTKTVPSNTGTDFPADVRMGLLFAVLNATGTTPGNSTLDWWACYQLR